MDAFSQAVDIGQLATSLISLQRAVVQGRGAGNAGRGSITNSSHIEAAIFQLKRYAQMGESLEDWKNLHDGLHQLNRLLPNVLSEAGVGTGKNTIDSTKRTWEIVELTVLNGYFGQNTRYAYVPEEVEVITSFHSTTRIRWKDELHGRCKRVSDLLGGSTPNMIDVRRELQDLRILVQQMIDLIDKELVERLAGVAAMSRKLSEELSKAPVIS